jgi:hypothetical protein
MKNVFLDVVPCGSCKYVVIPRATWHHIPEDSILYGHCCENLKSYKNEDT